MRDTQKWAQRWRLPGVRGTAVGSCLLVLSAVWSVPVQAQNEPAIEFDIPAGALADTLDLFGEQSSAQVVYSPESVEGRQSPAIRGAYGVQEALQLLLERSGLSAEAVGEKAFILKDPAAPSPAPIVPQPVSTDDATSASPQVAQRVGGIEEIVVTARRRAESAQTVPIAIAAVSAETLEQNQVRNAADLTSLVPALRVVPVSNWPADARLTLRGQTPIGSLSIINDQPVSLYVNGVYYARTQGVLGSLVDTRAVEVAKGPQGTLIGRNSTGGAVLIQSAEPGSEFGASLRSTIAQYGRRDINSVVNLPMTDSLSLRAVVSLQSSDGSARNVLDDQSAVGNYISLPETPPGGYRVRGLGDMGNESRLYRLMLKYAPSDDFSALLEYTRRTADGSGAQWKLLDWRDTPSASWSAQPTVSGSFTDIEGRTFSQGTLEDVLQRQRLSGHRDVETNGVAMTSGDFDVLSLRLDKRIGNVDLRFLNAVQSFDQNSFDRVVYGPIVRQVTYMPARGYKAYQSELTANWETELFGRNTVVTSGLFFFRESNDLDGVVTYSTTSTGPSGTNPSANLYNGENISYAAYAQVLHNLTDRLRLTVGARQSWDERELNQYNYNGSGCTLRVADDSTTQLNPCFRNTQDDFSRLTYNLSLDYQFDGMMVYATTRTGYKSGGLNGFAQAPGAIRFKSENVTDYEVGLKSDGFIGEIPFRANLALFYTDLKDQQQQLTVWNVGASPACVPGTPSYPLQCGAPGGIIVVNSAKSEVKGLEAELEFRPLRSVMVSLSGAYTAGEIIDYSAAVPSGYALSPGLSADFDGRPFNGPRTTLVGAVQYTLPFESLFGLPLRSMDLRGDVSYTGAAKFMNQGTDPLVKDYASSLTLANLRLGFNDLANSGLSVAAFVRNVFDERYYTGVSGPAVGAAGIFTGMPGDPRVFGVELALRFGGER